MSDWRADSIEGAFKIREPNPMRSSLIAPAAADLFLVPGVGFDDQAGNRLGRGKGHYDRYLSPLRRGSESGDGAAPRPFLIGVCFSVQLCAVPTEVHDIPLDDVLHA